MYIRRLSVKNYRSLKDVTVGDLSPVVILYGENNSGKSNVLSLLEQIFRKKPVLETLTLESAQDSLGRSEDFWEGEVDDFSDNFYKNSDEPIVFEVFIRLKYREISSLAAFPAAFLDGLFPGNRFNNLVIKGSIIRVDENRGRMILSEVTLNNKMFFERDKDKRKYLSGFSGLANDERLDVFHAVMGSLNNAFLRIPPDRYISRETEVARNEHVELSHNTIKNWLFQMSVSRDSEKVFQEIATLFNSPPFNFGRISLARTDDDSIDVFVEDGDSFKLPLGRKGSGLQQILMILAFVTMTKSSLLGIEELEINLSPESQNSIFNNLLGLVNSKRAPIHQVFLTTHSPLLAKRDEAARRGVWMENGATKITKPNEAEITAFFRR